MSQSSTGVIWINGEFVEREKARVSAMDAGLQHAVGLFETMLAVGGETIDLARHLERLRDSAMQLRLSDDLRAPALAEAVEAVVEKASLDRARVRLTITGGDLNLLAVGAGPADPTILIDARPATAYPEPMYEQGVVTTIADRRDNPLDPFAGHKTLNYWPRLAELQRASSKGAAEAVTLQVSNHLAGGCVSNLFIVKDDELFTPTARGEEEPGAIASPVLPGITRGRILEWAGDQDRLATPKLLTIDDLLDADEAFLTNSSWGVLPISRVEQKEIGGGAPGPVARAMLERWRQSWSS
jgi:branched-subunit amino acid aminotransferase/4-amino-4-deoxychorismate lyase